MRAYVFTDKGLERYAGRFVWLSVDTENAKNADFLTKYPIPALPTMLVIDPAKGAVAMRYVGGATVPQLEKLLDDARGVVRGGDNSADTLLESADRLAAEGKTAEAAKLYEQAIAKGQQKKNWTRGGRAAESYLFTLSSLPNESERCATAARDLYPLVKRSSSAANVASAGLSCAIAIDEKNAHRKELIDTLEKETREVFDDPKAGLSGDDRSGLYMSLIDARDAAGDKEGAAKLKQEWAAFLEKAAAEAKTPEQRAVYDSHRVGAYLDLGTPEKAIPMLEQSERDFPDDYNPPARLALAYNAMKKYDEALAASDRAMARVYGPRKLQVLRVRADIYAAKGDKESAKKTVSEALAYAKALPKGQRSERTIASLQKKLDSM